MSPFTLMNRDTVLLTFDFPEEEKFKHTISIREGSLKCIERNHNLYPFLLRNFCSERRFNLWLNNRVIPTERDGYAEIMKWFGFTGRTSLLLSSLALSLNDNFWIKAENSAAKWEDINLFDNKFSAVMAYLAIGVPTNSLHDEDSSSPDFTTKGVQRKFWLREKEGIFLYKEGKSEAVSEYLSSYILDIMGVLHIPYTIVKVGDVVTAKCRLFTTEDVSFVSFKEFLSFYSEDVHSFSPQIMNIALNSVNEAHSRFGEMILTDLVLRNEDRHMDNFGFMYDASTGFVDSFAPLFDHGFSLFAGKRDCKFALKSIPFDMSLDDVIAKSLCDCAFMDFEKFDFKKLNDKMIFLYGMSLLEESRMEAILSWVSDVFSFLSTHVKGCRFDTVSDRYLRRSW